MTDGRGPTHRGREAAEAPRRTVTDREVVPLPASLRDRLERSYGVALGDVRVHTGDRRVDAAGMLAVAKGRHLYFAPGQFAPGSFAGDELIAHEVFHALQGPRRSDDETVANRAAALAIEGLPASHLVPRDADASVARPRGKAELAPTPGGLRVGALDKPDAALVDEIRADLVAPDLWKLDALWRDKTGQDLVKQRFLDAINDPLWRARNAVTGISAPGRAGEVLAMMLTDVAVLVAERFVAKVFDFDRLSLDVARVCGTYERLASFHRLGLYIPAGEGKTSQAIKDAFDRRGQIFVRLATEKLSGKLGRVYEGLAADAERMLASTAVDHPLRGAELVVYELLALPPTDANLGHLRTLFTQVLDDVRGSTSGPAADAVRLLEQQLDKVVIDPARSALTEAGTTADDLETRRQDLAIGLGDYLASVDASNAVELTSHLQGQIAIWPGFVWVDSFDADLAAIKRSATAPTPTAAAPVAEPRPATPAPPVHTCHDYGYDRDYLARWLRSYFTDRPRFERWRFDAAELICQLAPNTHSPAHLATVKANVADFRELARAVLARIERHLKTARDHQHAIARLVRAAGGKVPPLASPDYVDVFALDVALRPLLPRVAATSPFDDAGTLEAIGKLTVPHFVDLERYQRALVDALQLVVDARRDKTDQYLRAGYPDTHGRDLDALSSLALSLPSWPSDERTLADGDGLALRVSMEADVIAQARADRELAHRAAIEQDVYSEVVRVTRLRAGFGKDKDYYDPSEAERMFEALDLHTLTQKGDDKLARGYVASALAQLNAERFESLQVLGHAAGARTDSLKAVEYARRFDALSRVLGKGPQKATVDEVETWAKQCTGNLVGIYAMAQGAIAQDTREWTPGNVIQATNLLNYVVENKGAVTLTEAYGMIANPAAWGDISDELSRKAGYKALIKDSDRGMFDAAELKLMGGLLPEGARTQLMRSASAKDGVMHLLLAVEKAGGGEGRKVALNRLAKLLEDRGGSGPLAVAAVIYSVVLDASQELQDPDQTAKDKADEDDKKGTARIPWMSTWVDESLANDSRDDYIAKLKANENPKRQGDDKSLSPAEIVARDAWIGIKGKAHWYSVGKEGWAHFWDWVKGLIKMAAITLATGGLGEAFGAAAGLSEGMTFGLKVGLFTAGMRTLNELTTMQRANTSFAEDFFVNFAMMKLGEMTQSGATRFFARRGITGMKAAAGVFAAEYATFTTIGMTHLVIRSALTNETVTMSEVKSELFQNFATLVAFRAVGALGKGASRVMGETGGLSKDVAHVIGEFDQRLEELAKVAKNAKSPEEAMKALDDQAAIIDKKAKLLKDSGNPMLEKLGEEYERAVAMYKDDVAKARLATRIKATPIANTPNFTYEAGGANEEALSKHLREQGYKVKVTKTLDGNIYDAETPDGPVRFTPRPKGIGSEGALYTPIGRLAGETPIETAGDLMTQLKADPATNIDIVNASGNTVTVFSVAGPCTVEIVPVDAHTVSSPHEAGPSVSHPPRMGPDGTWTMTIEVLRNTPHDQIVRSVNHEMAELDATLVAIAREGGDLSRFQAPELVDAVIAKQAKASSMRARGGGLTAHDVGVLEGDVKTAQEQLSNLITQSGQQMTSDQAMLLEQRKQLLLHDLERIWKRFDLPEDSGAFDRRIADLREQANQIGAPISNEAIGLLVILRTRRATLPQATDLIPQIVLNELAKVMTNKMYKASLPSFWQYVDNAVMRKANSVYRDQIGAGADQATALSAAVRIVEQGLGGLSIASMRGFGFEGLAVERLNRDPDFIAQRGRVSPLPAGFPTYDVVALKWENLGGVSAAGASGPLTTTTETVTNSKGETVRVVRISDAEGVVFEQDKDGGTPYERPGVSVFFLSFKAKVPFSEQAAVDEIQKATGDATSPKSGALFGSTEYVAAFANIVDAARERWEDAQRDVAAKKPGARRRELDARSQYDSVRWLQDRLMSLDDLRHADLDAMIQAMRDEGYDPRPLLDVLLAGGGAAFRLGDVQWTKVSIWMSEEDAARWYGVHSVPDGVVRPGVTTPVVRAGGSRPLGTGPVLVTFDVPNVCLDRSTSVWRLRNDGVHDRIIIRDVTIRGRRP